MPSIPVNRNKLKKKNIAKRRRDRLLKNQIGPQQFLQYEIDKNKFKMVLINEPNPQIYESSEKPHIPSGFKPIYTSTPKKSRKSFEIIDKPPLIGTPRLTMSQFIGQIPNLSEHNQNPGYSMEDKNDNSIVKIDSSKSSKTQNITRSNKKPQHSIPYKSGDSLKDLNGTEKVLKLIFEFDEQSKINDKVDETFPTYADYVEKQTSEAVFDWNSCFQTFMENAKRREDPDEDSRFILSFENSVSIQKNEALKESNPSVKSTSECFENIFFNHISPTITNKNGKADCFTEEVLNKSDQLELSFKNIESSRVSDVPFLPSELDFEEEFAAFKEQINIRPQSKTLVTDSKTTKTSTLEYNYSSDKLDELSIIFKDCSDSKLSTKTDPLISSNKFELFKMRPKKVLKLRNLRRSAVTKQKIPGPPPSKAKHSRSQAKKINFP